MVENPIGAPWTSVSVALLWCRKSEGREFKAEDWKTLSVWVPFPN